jgi:anti-sigma B factor antagonist
MQAVSERGVRQSALEVYHAGELTVLGFGSRAVLHELNLAEYRDEIAELVQTHHCRVLAFDLTAVRCVPRGLLGILQCLLRQEIETHLYNATDEIRTLLALSHLDRDVQLHHLDIDVTSTDNPF